MGVITFFRQFPLLDPLIPKPLRGRYILHEDAMDEEIATAFWTGAKASAVEMEGRWWMPGRLEVRLSPNLLSRFSSAGRLDDLRDFLQEHLKEYAYREYYQFRMEKDQTEPEVVVKPSETPDLVGKSYLSVSPQWPAPAPEENPSVPAENPPEDRGEAPEVVPSSPKAVVPQDNEGSWANTLPGERASEVEWGRYLFAPHDSQWEECLELTLTGGRARWFPPQGLDLFLQEEEVAQKLILAGLLHDTTVFDSWANALAGRLHPHSSLVRIFGAIQPMAGSQDLESVRRLVAEGTQFSQDPSMAQRGSIGPLFRMDLDEQLGRAPRTIYVALGTKSVPFSVSGSLAMTEPAACQLALPEGGGGQPSWLPPLPSASRRWAIREVKPSWRPGLNPTRNEKLLDSFCPAGHRSWRLTAEGADLLATRDDTLLVGREPTANDLALSQDGRVTGTAHCAFLLDPAGVVSIVDLGSTNGTEVNGRRLAAFEAVALHQGDLIRAGATPIRIIA